ncbi:D-alanine--D-alanine ligase [Halotalea alkalilenta]|uniref:D-alanine--D-alanine ligase n=1 Tax=Halotalea alkalilenta TaxID=376489 RepID=A0A172YHR1_9GAMM|nr:D-alanine--D-alanine ligase [Halotalea alkalilenta]ANF58794.1 D-alanine--D-alanine ligase A [Halotalea alkalilenta]
MTKTRIGLIFGGKSAEHEVSLQSAKNIVDALDKTRFEVTMIGIDKQGQWHLNDASNFLLDADDPSRIALRESNRDLAVMPGRSHGQWLEADAGALAQLDVIFPIVHGTLGEDGSLQGLLRILDLPQVGSGVLGSAICMDKDVAKRLLRDAGLQVAPFVSVTRTRRASLDFDAVVDQLGLPLFVKPASQGSSVGVSKVVDRAGFERALDEAFSFDHKVLIEQAIEGREIECAVLGNDAPRASLCGEILLSDEFYSYDTKYISESGARLSIPAELTDAQSEAIQAVALETFALLECQGMARVDVFLTEDDRVVVNEVNTLPGFTRISMYPKLWEASGLSYSELLTTLIALARERHTQDLALKSSRSER